MPSYQTKLKVGRKLEGVDTATASDNQISALFRFDEDGAEDHVSLSIESDTMDADDVFAVFQLLHDRGVLTAQQAKTWLHQPKASRESYGETTEWAGTDLNQKVSMLSKGLKVRSSGNGGPDPAAAAKLALVKVSEVESKLGELKATLRGSQGSKGSGEASSTGGAGGTGGTGDTGITGDTGNTGSTGSSGGTEEDSDDASDSSGGTLTPPNAL